MSDFLLLESGDNLLTEGGDDFLTEAAATSLEWLPTYPDYFPRPERAAAWVFVENIDPIPRPDPPTELTWHPTYPDRLTRARRVLTPPSTFQWPMVPVGDLRWLPRYPEQLRRKQLPVASMPSFFSVLGVQENIAATEAWKAVYPDRLVRPRRASVGQQVWNVDPGTILAAASCVEWTDETVVRPEMEEEGFTRPRMVCIPGSGSLLQEDGVFFLLLESGGQILLEDDAGAACETYVRPMMTEEDWC